MKQILTSIGWQILEYLRRMVTPFIINLLYGMTMFAASAIDNDPVRIVLVMLLLAATLFTDFMFMRGAGEIAYKMRLIGERKRANLPTSPDSKIGTYRSSKEYRPYNGFIIGFLICLIPLVLILVGALANSSGCRAALLFVAGWSYFPIFVISVAGSSEGSLAFSSMLWGLIILFIVFMACGIAYILGGRVEKERQAALDRRSASIEEQKRAREEKKR